LQPQENHPPASPGGGVPLGMTTLADKLNASGYRTHQIGK
jgi:arylsulfatase A-like enzyme